MRLHYVHDEAHYVVRRADGTPLSVPAWMTHPEAACLETVATARHADEKAAAFAVAAGSFFDVVVELAPAAEVEIADAEVRAVEDFGSCL